MGREMGIDAAKIGVQIRKFTVFSMKIGYRSVCNHPFLAGFVCFLLLLYRSFPFGFSLLVSSSPVLVCTAILLGTLLSFGKPNLPEIEKEDRVTTHEIASLRTGVLEDNTVVERGGIESSETVERGGIESFATVERYVGKGRDVVENGVDESSPVENRVSDVGEDGVSVDYVPLIDETSREIQFEKQVIEEGEGEFKDSESEKKRDIQEGKQRDEGKSSDREVCKGGDENLRVENDKSLRESIDVHKEDHLGSPMDLSWKRIGEDHDNCDRGDDDESSDSGSDGAESSSPDASMADIIPLLDELHPLLDLESSQPAQMTHDESGEDTDNQGEEGEGEDDNDDEEEDGEAEKGGKEDESKSAIKWTEVDQKNLMDLGTSELERNQRLENLIARRRARKSLRVMAEQNLIDLESSDLPFNVPPISTTRRNPFELPYDTYENMAIPGSAPSILAPRRNPFDLPYDPNEEKPDLKGDSFQQEFTESHIREPVFRRNETFSVGPSIFGPPKQEKQDFKWRPYFVPERFYSEEGTSYPSIQRQLSEISESKVSSVLDTESVSSAVDEEDKKLHEQVPEQFTSEGTSSATFQRQISEISESKVSSVPDTESVNSATDEEEMKLNEQDVSREAELMEQVEHGSQSSEDVDSVDIEQAEKRDSHPDEVEITSGDVENHHEMEPSLSGTGGTSISKELNANEIHLKTGPSEEEHTSTSSLSSLSEVDDRTLDINIEKRSMSLEPEASQIESSRISTQTSLAESEFGALEHKEPVYDSSPPGMEKFLSFTSISPDTLQELAEMGYPQVLLGSADREPEVQMASSNLSLSHQNPLVTKQDPIIHPSSSSLEADHGQEHSLDKKTRQVEEDKAESSSGAKIDSGLHQDTVAEVVSPDSNYQDASSILEKQLSMSGRTHGAPVILTDSVEQKNIVNNTDVSKVHVRDGRALKNSLSMTSDSTSTPFQSPEYGSPSGEYMNEILQRIVCEDRGHDEEVLYSAEAYASPADEESVDEEADEIKEIDQGLLSELDAVGDFSFKGVVGESLHTELTPKETNNSSAQLLPNDSKPTGTNLELPVPEGKSIQNIDLTFKQLDEGEDAEEVVLPSMFEDHVILGGSMDTNSGSPVVEARSLEDVPGISDLKQISEPLESKDLPTEAKKGEVVSAEKIESSNKESGVEGNSTDESEHISKESGVQEKSAKQIESSTSLEDIHATSALKQVSEGNLTELSEPLESKDHSTEVKRSEVGSAQQIESSTNKESGVQENSTPAAVTDEFKHESKESNVEETSAKQTESSTSLEAIGATLKHVFEGNLSQFWKPSESVDQSPEVKTSEVVSAEAIESSSNKESGVRNDSVTTAKESGVQNGSVTTVVADKLEHVSERSGVQETAADQIESSRSLEDISATLRQVPDGNLAEVPKDLSAEAKTSEVGSAEQTESSSDKKSSVQKDSVTAAVVDELEHVSERSGVKEKKIEPSRSHTSTEGNLAEVPKPLELKEEKKIETSHIGTEGNLAEVPNPLESKEETKIEASRSHIGTEGNLAEVPKPLESKEETKIEASRSHTSTEGNLAEVPKPLESKEETKIEASRSHTSTEGNLAEVPKPLESKEEKKIEPSTSHIGTEGNLAEVPKPLESKEEKKIEPSTSYIGTEGHLAEVPKPLESKEETKIEASRSDIGTEGNLAEVPKPLESKEEKKFEPSTSHIGTEGNLAEVPKPLESKEETKIEASRSHIGTEGNPAEVPKPSESKSLPAPKQNEADSAQSSSNKESSGAVVDEQKHVSKETSESSSSSISDGKEK